MTSPVFTPVAPARAQSADGWRVRTGLSFREVERLLDWLESQGRTQREVRLDADGVTVRWWVEPGYRADAE